jgi:hypothetical protein
VYTDVCCKTKGTWAVHAPLEASGVELVTVACLLIVLHQCELQQLC